MKGSRQWNANLYVQNGSRDLPKKSEKIVAKSITKAKGLIVSPFAPGYAIA